MKHTEYIIPIGEEAKEFDEIFIGVLRKHEELIRCKDCELFYKNRSPFEQHKCDSGNDTGYCFWAVRREEC